MKRSCVGWIGNSSRLTLTIPEVAGVVIIIGHLVWRKALKMSRFLKDLRIALGDETDMMNEGRIHRTTYWYFKVEVCAETGNSDRFIICLAVCSSTSDMSG